MTPTPTPASTGYPPSTGSPSPTATPLSGLGFNATVMPSSNDEFGLRTVEHLFNDKPGDPFSAPRVIATAPVALFYNATATTHPPGGPPGYTHDAIPDLPIATPNWIYYYSQAWTPPCPIWYAPAPLNLLGSYTHGPFSGDSFVRLNNAYVTSRTLIMRQVNGQLTIVGSELVKGIDTFARVATHENTHKRCWEKIFKDRVDGREESANDSDQDGVPDDWERVVGLTVGVQDTTGFGSYWGGYGTSNGTSPEGDSEAFARLHEEGVFGPIGADWSDQGLEWGNTPPNFYQRTLPQALGYQPISSFPGTPISPLP